MDSYTVNWVSRKVTQNGDSYLSLKLDDIYVNFFRSSDVEVSVKEGDHVTCSIEQKGQYRNGYHLKIVVDARKNEENVIVKPVPKDEIDKLIASDDEFFRSKPFEKPDIKTIYEKEDGSYKKSLSLLCLLLSNSLFSADKQEVSPPELKNHYRRGIDRYSRPAHLRQI